VETNRERQKVMLEASIPEVGLRAAAFARTRWPSNTAKRLQSELDISEATADRVLAGKTSGPVLTRMIARWGWAFAHFAFEPLAGSFTPVAIQDRIDEVERKAVEITSEINRLRAEAEANNQAAPARDNSTGVAVVSREFDGGVVVVSRPGKGQ
jgi:hypothetical protein